MATNLKKSKKIRAFCYRVLAVGAFVVMIVYAIIGGDVWRAFGQDGFNLLTGEIYYLPEFREYMVSVYNNAMWGYAGVGDDKGYPLTTDTAEAVSALAKRDFQTAVRHGDILYYIQDGETVETNFKYPIFSEYDGHLILPERIFLCYYWDGPSNTLTYLSPSNPLLPDEDSLPTSSEQYSPNNENAKNIRLVLAINPEKAYSTTRMNDFVELAYEYRIVLSFFLASAVLLIICLILCLFSRKAAKEAMVSFAQLSEKVWLEAKLVLIGIMVYLLSRYHPFSDSPNEFPSFGDLLPWALLCFVTSCLLYLAYKDLSINGGKIFMNSLVVKLSLTVAELVEGKPWYRRSLGISLSLLLGAVFSIAMGVYLLILDITPLEFAAGRTMRRTDLAWLLTALSILLIFAGVFFALMYIHSRNYIRDTKAIADKLSSLQLGALNTPLTLSKHSLLAQTAEDINKLESGIENAVEQKDRSNRMRVELITNVSHDLKTPLTSIINYADLLCEEQLPETAAGYATSLRAKAYRLKNMVQDVFELSKATSGNLPVEEQLLDLVKLIRQTLADMDERISGSSLTFKTVISTEPIMIMADGDKLYRVFQNLFVNALQYSLENSRVYVQLSVEDGRACARVKNTSKNELDFDTTEIMERFVRADASRTTEGSGLGLSIVQSFTEACGGSFNISTDADMFIACVSFPLAEATAPKENVLPADTSEPAQAALAQGAEPPATAEKPEA